MSDFSSAPLYLFSFFAVYGQVFLLLVFFRERKKVRTTKIPTEQQEYAGVTIIVPCWNEEKTVAKTVESLLALDYPKDKYTIKIIDDGSTDKTWEVIQQYANHPNIELIHKENGGKHTAMNLGIETSKDDFIACLDADAFVDNDALKKMMTFFVDPSVMSVSPSILVYKPKTVFQKAQKVEYDMAVFVKKMLGLISGIHVSPGPFSIYRKKVFIDLGLYRKAHNTEDMEIAYRMQINGYRIEQCHDAFVHTVTPSTLKTLFKQRLRWMYGFINNTIDYRSYILRPKYGAFSMFTVPLGVMALFGTLAMFFVALYAFVKGAILFFEKASAIGFQLPVFNGFQFDAFFFDARPITFIMVVLYLLLVGIALYGQKMRNERPIPKLSFMYFIIVYSVLGPFWLLQAMYNSVFSRETAWR